MPASALASLLATRVVCHPRGLPPAWFATRMINTGDAQLLPFHDPTLGITQR